MNESLVFESVTPVSLSSASPSLPVARIVGIDLALTGPHTFVLLDGQYRRLGAPWKAADNLDSLERMWERCRKGLAPEARVMFVMEPTGHAWSRMVAFLLSKGEAALYVPSMRKFSALRKTLNVGVKSDDIDALALAKIPAVAGDLLKPVTVFPPQLAALKRLMKMYEQCTDEIVRAKTRLHALFGLLNPGALMLLVNNGEFGPAARGFIKQVWTPCVVESQEQLRGLLAYGGKQASISEETLQKLFERCQANGEFVKQCEAMTVLPITPQMLKVEGEFLLDALETAEKRRVPVERERDRLLKEIDPLGELQSILGIGPQLAAVILAYTGPIGRFENLRSYKGYIGFVPGSSQTGGNKPAKGGGITKAGPNPLKHAYFMAASVGMLWDPQLAEFACRLQERGLEYRQFTVAVANKVAARVYAVLKRVEKRNSQEDNGGEKPVTAIGYELRTPEGEATSKKEARELIDARYRLKTARNKTPSRGAESEQTKTSPESARQSLTPQPETAPKDSWEIIILKSACPEHLKRHLKDRLTLLEQHDNSSLKDYLGLAQLDEDLVLMQVHLLELRSGIKGRNPG